MKNYNEIVVNTDVRIPTALAHLENKLSASAFKVYIILILLGRHLKSDEDGFFVIDEKTKKILLLACNGSIESKNYERIYSALNELYEQSLRYNFFGVDSRGGIKERFLISLSRNDEMNSIGSKKNEHKWERNIYFKYHPKALEIIKEPYVFGLPYLLMMAVLSGDKYSYPLYIYLCDAFCRKKHEVNISFLELKTIIGMETTKYGKYNDFKVIIKSIFDKINRKTEFFCDYVPYKEGRKFAGLQIKIKKQPLQLSIFDSINKNEVDDISKLLADVIGEHNLFRKGKDITIEHNFELEGLMQIINKDDVNIDYKLVKKTMDKVGREGVIEIYEYAIKQLNKSKRNLDPISNPERYIAKCLRKEYGLKTSEEREIIKQKEKLAQIKENEKQKNKLIEEYKTLYKKEKKSITKNIFQKIRDEKHKMQSFLDDLFSAQLQNISRTNKISIQFRELKEENKISANSGLWGLIYFQVENDYKNEYPFKDFNSWLEYKHININRVI